MRNRIQMLSLLFGIMALLTLSQAYAASTPMAPLPLPDNEVHDLYVSNGRIYLTGNFSNFTLPDTSVVVRNGLAAMDLASGTIVSSWTPSLDDGAGNAGVGEVLLPSADGKTLFVGGRFARVDGVDHNLIAAIDIDVDSASYGQVKAWDPQLVGTAVLALAMSPVNTTLYVGGEFTASGSLVRQNMAAIDSVSAVTLPWAPDPNGIVHTILPVPDASRLYIGGEFTTIGSSNYGRDSRAALAAVSLANAAVQAWDAGLAGALVSPASVNAMVFSPDTAYLTIAGKFTDVGNDTRVNLARLDATSAIADSTWIADTDGPVYDLIQIANGDLFVGGSFTMVQGQGSFNLAMLRGDTNTVAPWSPQIGSGGGVYSLAVDTDNARLLVGGNYVDIGGDNTYQNLAAYSIVPPVTISTSDGGFSSSTELNVTLSCTDQSGGGCFKTYYTLDNTEPTTASATYGAAFKFDTPDSTTTLKYFSEDVDGNHESIHSETYIIDKTRPQTTASPAPPITDPPTVLTLNAATYVPVELMCDDGANGSGCAVTYYTLDGTTPTTASAVYSGAIDLPDGDTTVRYFSVDQAGNIEAEGSQEYTVDQALPTISVSPDSGNYPPPLDVTIRCDDGAGTGCDQIYLVTDGSVPTDTATPFSYSGDITLTLTRASVLRIEASDVAGNSGSSIVGIYTFTDPSPVKRNGSGAFDGIVLALLALLAFWRLRIRINGENAACR